MKRFLLLSVFLFVQVGLFSQQRQPVSQLSDDRAETHAYINATIVPMPGEKWEKGILVVREDQIVDAGKGIAIPKEAIIHDLNGQWIYPGFIEVASYAGQKSVVPYSRPSTIDPQFGRTNPGPYYWNESIHPEVDLLETFQMEEAEKESFRKLGFTTVNIIPNDGIFRGTGYLLNLGEGRLQEELLLGQSSTVASFSKGSAKQEYPNSLMGQLR